MIKKILGLDLGTSSIGWALIAENNDTVDIIGIGTRIIPLSTDEKDEFSAGNQISKNQKRTAKRTQRKGYDRYQLRRKALVSLLKSLDVLPEEDLMKLDALELWKIRANAVNQKIELKEFARVLLHLNQKRGYKSSRSDANLGKKDTEYVAEVKGRHQLIKEQGITIGQKFYSELMNNSNYRIKQQVFPREAYIEEFDLICEEQKKHYPEIITDELVEKLKNKIIYYQRKLKSQKGLISICEFEGFFKTNKKGKDVFVGPRVAPRSSPLFQVCKIWETINNLTLKNRSGEKYEFTSDDKQKIFEYLDNNEKLTATELYKLLELNKNDGWYHNKQIERGIQGNMTKAEILKVLNINDENLIFNLNVDEEPLVDKDTGEILEKNTSKIIRPDIEDQPLYQLWHVIYSISDTDECENALIKKFGFDSETAKKLANIDFRKGGFGNKSSKAMRKILPYLIEGYMYSDACSLAGYNHSGSLTTDENLKRVLIDKLALLPKNSLRQPVVEKILNQMINLVNAIIEKYGKPDEIRIELARELKQSKEERNDTFKFMNKREKENEIIRKRLIEEYNVRATRNNVIKFRLFEEIENEDSKINAMCIYCGKHFGITDALSGDNVDVEHIIPKSLLFDDSQSNKTLSHRHCNEAKGNRTAYDFMASKGKNELEDYLHRIEMLYKNRIIGKTKRDKLLMPQNKIPLDFIERQLRETQYISKKAREILMKVCRNVWSTSGSVTEYLRALWGWNDVLHNLQFPVYKEHGFTEIIDWESNGQLHTREVIKGWNKREDHRHHAIDALVIACTKQGFIQRINNLSSKGNREEMYELIRDMPFELRENLSLLEKYLIMQRPFTTAEVENKAAEILISFKPGKKVATTGKRIIKKNGRKKVVQTGIIVPRGSLSEESVYGRIKALSTDFKSGMLEKHPAKFLFNNPHLIFKPYIKNLVEARLAEYNDDVKKALASLKKKPIFLDKNNSVELTYATCFSDEYVLKYPIESIKPEDVKYIIDKQVQRLVKQRLDQYDGKPKEAFKEPVWFNEEKQIAIRSVRCFTGLSSTEPIKYDEAGNPIGFVLPGNNHHVAFYINSEGKIEEHICTFWHAVDRKRFDLPVIIKDPKVVWDKIITDNIELPASFIEKLPADGWVFMESMQQNEMFVFGLDNDIVTEALRLNDKKTICNNLYRIQKLSKRYYVFRHHLETSVKMSEDKKMTKKFMIISSIGSYISNNPIKITIDYLGDMYL